MFKNTFDPSKPMTYVTYTRMSTDQQNPRSPEQQIDNIESLIRRQGRPWSNAGNYRDDGISGRYVKARPQYQKMLKDIELRHVKPDLILVDSLDRFGRNEEVPEVRRRLEQRFGVLILTVDSGFADPTTTSGKVMSAFDSLRAMDENRIKAHMVVRGKRDAARERHWPGGPAPFGYRLEYVYRERNGRQEVDYSRLAICAETSWIVRLAFEKAWKCHWGMTRIARFLNDNAEIPGKFKPFSFSTVGRWLDNRIYYGALVWDKVSTGVVEDRRVTIRNAIEDQTVVEDFCEPIVSRELWEKVETLKAARTPVKLKASETGAIAVSARRMAMRYPFTGIVRCGMCGRSMIPNGTAKYTDRMGQEHRYVSYCCPGTSDKSCSNRLRFSEEWVRVTATSMLLRRHGVTKGIEAQADQAITELSRLVITELERLSAEEPCNLSALLEEAKKRQRENEGWFKSLACPELPNAVRQELAKSWDFNSTRISEIEQVIEFERRRRQEREITFDLDALNAALTALPELIGGDNATLANFHLSLHFRSIDCFDDGRVRFVISRLGILPNIQEVVEQIRSETETSSERVLRHVRRRGKLATPSLLCGDDSLMEFATDPHRFDGVPEQFFWIEEMQVPTKRSWAEEFAEEIYARRSQGNSVSQLQEHFGRSKTTIQSAIRIALQRRCEQELPE